MNFPSLTWQDDVLKCFELKKNQQNFYGEIIDNNNSCLLKVDVSTQVSLINFS